MREIWFAVLFAIAVVGSFPALAQAPKADPKAAASLLAVNSDDRVLGKPDAPITIIEYASLSCPHCAHFELEVLPKLEKKWIDTGKAKLVLRDFPLDAPALEAAVVARCAPPERFYPLVQTLFGSQEKWVLAKDQKAALEKVVRLAGMGKQEFEACLSNKALSDKVAESRLVAAQQLGVDSTPTFFVNGTKLEGAPTEEAFDQALSAQAAAKS